MDETGAVVVDPKTGGPEVAKVKRLKYPGGWRVVTVTNSGMLVLMDRGNPNINSEIDREATSKTFLYDNHPYYWANSYEDSTSVWGFASSEQVGDLNLKINEMLSRLARYLNRVTAPILILPKDTGVNLSDLDNRAGLVLQPTSTAVAGGIRYVSVPNLPSNFFEALNLYLSFFDRVSQIEEADRGVAPTGVIAASAIVRLQERNQVMIQAKIMSVDYLVRQRGRISISFLQNFGISPRRDEIDGEPVVFTGVEMIGRNFNYVVESGSTVAKTSVQVQAQAEKLYDQGVIDREAYLEVLNFPGWKSIIERTSEGQLDQALQILVGAGMDEEAAKQLRAYLLEPQTGSSAAAPSGAGQPQPGTPKSKQNAG